jgi:hypothetical protein
LKNGNAGKRIACAIIGYSKDNFKCWMGLVSSFTSQRFRFSSVFTMLSLRETLWMFTIDTSFIF